MFKYTEMPGTQAFSMMLEKAMRYNYQYMYGQSAMSWKL